MRSQPAVADNPRRDRILIASCILLVTALAWAYLVHLDYQMSSSLKAVDIEMRMAPMIGSPWGATDFLFTFSMWSVMMIGMMAPAAAPVLLLYSRMNTQRPDGRVPIAVLAFALGYIGVWFGFSAAAALAQWALHQGALLSSSMAATSPRLAGAILIAAGAYQLTPAKGACLRHCRSPLGFLMSNWRDGATGAFQMGLRHGVYCLGCCWALMLVLFAVGVMNLAWVAALTAFILVEKFGRTGPILARAGAVVMIAWGVFAIVTNGHL